MCLILVAWRAHPEYPLVVAANRDEFYSRPTAPAGFWPESPDILGGRDLQAGGTWLGISRRLRFAALTNFREGGPQLANAPSRGALVSDFLNGNSRPEAFLASLSSRGALYNGFNLLFGDRRRLAYFSNRLPSPSWLAPGIYGLSNHLLDTPWPKLSDAKASFAQALTKLPESAAFFDLLSDEEIVADEHLPQSGVPLEWERILSAVFVTSPNYGTRASTLLTVDQKGRTTLRERSFGPAALPIGEVCETFQSQPLSSREFPPE